MQAMMEVIAPLGVQTKPARLAPSDHARIIQVALGDQQLRATEAPFQTSNLLSQLLQEGERAPIDQGVDRVEPQGIEVKALQPVQRVITKEAPHLVGARAIEVHRWTPRCGVVAREVGPEVAEVIPVGTEVVVND